MKNKTLKYMFSVLLSVIVIICLFLFLYIKYKNISNQKKLLNQADNIINENIINYDQSSQILKSEEEKNIEEKEQFSIDKISKDNNIIGKIKIDKIGIEAPIIEGTTAEILKKSVGHFSNTSYWNGNVVLASHNRGSYAHYFENINKLNINDEIIYQTKLGTRVYVVNKIEQISEEDLSVLENTEENIITLITCIKNKSNLRLCVKATEKL